MSSQPWTWTFIKSIPSDLEAGHAAIDELLKALQDAHWDEHDIFQIHVAIEEAVVNAIEHGNQRNPSKSVQLDFRINDDEVHLYVTDEGEGFDPDSLPDPTADENVGSPRGRGVMMIRQFMTEAHYVGRGNALRMIKRKSR